jgi:N-methylhydantoinase A
MARRLGIEQVYIPKHAAVFAALGGASAYYGHVLNRFLYRRDDQMDVPDIKTLYDSMEQEASDIFARQGISTDAMLMVRSAEMRYFGQLHDIDILLPATKIGRPFTDADLKTLIDAFHSRHAALYGWGDPKLPVVIALPKVRAIAKRHPLKLTKQPESGQDPLQALKRRRSAYFKEMGGYIDTPCFEGNLLQPGNVIEGPAIIEEEKTTVVIPPDSNILVDTYSNYFVNLS